MWVQFLAKFFDENLFKSLPLFLCLFDLSLLFIFLFFVDFSNEIYSYITHIFLIENTFDLFLNFWFFQKSDCKKSQLPKNQYEIKVDFQSFKVCICYCITVILFSQINKPNGLWCKVDFFVSMGWPLPGEEFREWRNTISS